MTSLLPGQGDGLGGRLVGIAAGAPSSLVGAAADQLEQRRFVVAFSPQLWHSVACFCAGVACFFASSTICREQLPAHGGGEGLNPWGKPLGVVPAFLFEKLLSVRASLLSTCPPPYFRKFICFLPEVREFIKDTGPKTNTTRGGRKAHRPTPKTRTIHPTVLPDR